MLQSHYLTTIIFPPILFRFYDLFFSQSSDPYSNLKQANKQKHLFIPFPCPNALQDKDK